jgi:hypothetical protein
VTSPDSWFLASQVTSPLLGESSMTKPPAWSRTCWATARSESTFAAVDAPWVETTSYTPAAVRERSSSTSAWTSVVASSAKRLLCQALTPPIATPVTATLVTASATTLVPMPQASGRAQAGRVIRGMSVLRVVRSVAFRLSIGISAAGAWIGT